MEFSTLAPSTVVEKTNAEKQWAPLCEPDALYYLPYTLVPRMYCCVHGVCSGSDRVIIAVYGKGRELSNVSLCGRRGCHIRM